MINKKKLILFACALLLVGGVVQVFIKSERTAITLGFMYKTDQLSPLSPTHQFPDVIRYSKISEANRARSHQEFIGPVVLLLEDQRLEFPNTLATYWINAGYITNIDILEKEGRYTRDEAAEKLVEYIRIFRTFPEWSLWKGSEYVLENDDDIRSYAHKILGEFHPSGLSGSDKLYLIQSNVRMTVGGKDFAHSLHVNMTYDESEPDHPYRFAFHIGILAKAARCVGQIDSLFYFGPDHPGVTIDPEVMSVFSDIDLSGNISDEVLRPLIDEYLFNRCTLDDPDPR